MRFLPILSFLPAEHCVFLQFSTDFIGFLNHQGQLHGIPLWRDCNREMKHYLQLTAQS